MRKGLVLAALCALFSACTMKVDAGILCKVYFDLNYSGGTGAPTTQHVSPGALAAAPSDPTREGYTFGGWFTDADCTDSWNFSTDIVNADKKLYAKWIPDPAGTIYSVEVGNTLWGKDYGKLTSLPSGGILLSAWTKVPVDYEWNLGFLDSGVKVVGLPSNLGSNFYSKGNMNIFKLDATNWTILLLDGNMQVRADGALYNANSELWGPLEGSAITSPGDYCLYLTTEVNRLKPWTVATGWVWVAWYIQPSSSNVKMVQYLKFGPSNAVFRSSRPAEDENAAANSPGPYSVLQIGDDRGYLYHVRIDSLSSEPTLDKLEAIAQGTESATTAWADYAFVWKDGAAEVVDRSGHNRSMSFDPAAKFYKGPPIPTFD